MFISGCSPVSRLTINTLGRLTSFGTHDRVLTDVHAQTEVTSSQHFSRTTYMKGKLRCVVLCKPIMPTQQLSLSSMHAQRRVISVSAEVAYEKFLLMLTFSIKSCCGRVDLCYRQSIAYNSYL